jgi:hypothetical protein
MKRCHTALTTFPDAIWSHQYLNCSWFADMIVLLVSRREIRRPCNHLPWPSPCDVYTC